jgi:hypothetical protein
LSFARPVVKHYLRVVSRGDAFQVAERRRERRARRDVRRDEVTDGTATGETSPGRGASRDARRARERRERERDTARIFFVCFLSFEVVVVVVNAAKVACVRDARRDREPASVFFVQRRLSL